jgi:hypothetical protein
MTVIPSFEEEEKINKKDKLSKEVSQLEELKKSAMKLESEYSRMLPKISPKLIKDLGSWVIGQLGS